MNQKEKEKKLKDVDEQIALLKKGLSYETTDFVRTQISETLTELGRVKFDIESELVPTLVEINNRGEKTEVKTGKGQGYTSINIKAIGGVTMGSIISIWFDYNSNKYRVYIPVGMRVEVEQ